MLDLKLDIRCQGHFEGQTTKVSPKKDLVKGVPLKNADICRHEIMLIQDYLENVCF